MTEIPEHLLRRSRERRAALGLGGDGGGGEESSAGALPSSSQAATPAKATPAKAAATKAAAPAIIESPAVVVPAYVRPTGPHKLPIPLWVMPVIVALPFWAFFFPGAFSNHTPPSANPLVIGNNLYQANCSTCHGAQGQGGVGPMLHGGQAVLTFPNIADQIAWVENGSIGLTKNEPYGNPNRPGGQHVASKDDMPSFKSSLSLTQIQEIVNYERTAL